MSDLDVLFTNLSGSFQQQQFIKLTLSDRREKSSDMRNVFVKPVLLKAGLQLCFVFRHATKDVTKNYTIAEAEPLLRELLTKSFRKADLFTTTGDWHFAVSKNGKSVLLNKAATFSEAVQPQHDHAKKRYVQSEGNVYLRELGITTTDGKVKSDMQHKYRQINKYVEIVESIVKSAGLPAAFQVTDMGAGKGYLTFALYDYLRNVLQLDVRMTGVELRPELVDNGNRIAAQAGFANLNFMAGSIDTAELPATNMLIALHACDTATDQAIFRGIMGNAQIIVCSPCCHQQLRPQLHPQSELKAISKFGILEERQAEILTDTIRALVLEAFGYKANVFEFIPTEHTPKNLLIVGVKTKQKEGTREAALKQISELKAMFGIQHHALEKLMAI